MRGPHYKSKMMVQGGSTQVRRVRRRCDPQYLGCAGSDVSMYVRSSMEPIRTAALRRQAEERKKVAQSMLAVSVA